MKLTDRIDTFVARFGGSFDLSPEDGEALEHDQEVTFLVTGRVTKAALDTTRGGNLRLCYVIMPSETRVISDPEIQQAVQYQVNNPHGAIRYEPRVVPYDPDEHMPVPDDGIYDSSVGAEVFVPTNGHRVSNVQPRSNIAGTSQVERDKRLSDFVWGER